MKALHSLIGLLLCGFLIGCAHSDKSCTMFPGAFIANGVTYYPAHPGTTNYGTVDYTTNPPPAGVIPSVTVVTTNAHVTVNLVDGKGLISTDAVSK